VPEPETPPSLLQLLAQLYPSVKDALRLAAEVGIQPQYVRAEGTGLDAWTSVLEGVGARLPTLVKDAAREFPARADALTAATQAWTAAQEAMAAAQGASPPLPHASLCEGPGLVGEPATEVPYFMGRDDELGALAGAVRLPESEAILVLVTGLEGVGKTSLVQQLVATRAAALFPGGVAWLDGAALPAELTRAAVRFGWPGARPPDTAQAHRWLADVLHELDVLVVVDNVAEQVDVRLLPIPGGRCRTVITSASRTLAEGTGKKAKTIALDSWKNATGRDYLRLVAGAPAETADGELEALVDVVGGLPLAVRLIARMLERADATAAKVLTRIRERQLAPIDGAAQGADRGVAATFRSAIADLDAGVATALLALAAAAPATQAEVVAAITGTGADDAGDALDKLADRWLASFTKGNDRPWGMHPLLRMFLGKQDGFPALADAHRAFATTYAAAHAAPQDWQAMERGAPEVLAAVNRLLTAHDGPGASALVDAIASHLGQRGRLVELADLYARLLPLLPAGTAAGAAAQVQLCGLHASTGHLDDGVAAGRAALALYQQLGDGGGEAGARKALAGCYRLLGDLAGAVDQQQQALTWYTSSADVVGRARALANLGICFMEMGDLPKAVDFDEQALAIFEQRADARRQAVVLANLAAACLLAGDLPRALDSIQRALAFAEQLGDLAGQCLAHGNLAEYHLKVGDAPKALAAAQQTLAAADKLREPEYQANALLALGSAYLAMGDVPRAFDADQRALAVCNDGFGDPPLQAAALGNLARDHRAAGAIDEATPCARRALELLRKAGRGDAHPDVIGLITLLAELQPAPPPA
jgi:tetratricopeptide (TPR) repeat protein